MVQHRSRIMPSLEQAHQSSALLSLQTVLALQRSNVTSRTPLHLALAHTKWLISKSTTLLSTSQMNFTMVVMLGLSKSSSKAANPDPELGDMRSEYDGGNNPHPFLVGTVVPQAMSMAVDRNLIAEQLYGFAGVATCNVIPAPVAVASEANNACLTQDIAGANALLDDAGIMDSDGDGFRELDGMPLVVRYQTSTNSVRQKTQALIKQWWAEIGVDTELLNHDAGVFFGGDPNSPDTYQKFFTDVEMYTTGPDIDAQLHLSNWLCEQIPGKDKMLSCRTISWSRW